MSVLRFACLVAGLVCCAVSPVFAGGAREGEVVPFASDCGSAGCRDGGTTLQITGHDGKNYEIPVQHSPYVMTDGTIVIYPGETLQFDFPGAGDTLGAPHLLTKGEAAVPHAPTLTLDYKNEASVQMMLLNLTNGSTKFVKVDAYMGFPSSNGWKLHYTSTCTLMPNLFDMESWAAPLGPILITNIRYVPASGSVSCE